MIPSLRLYQLLLLGTVIGVAIALVRPSALGLALLITLLWDSVILSLAIADSLRVKGDRVSVARLPLQRLSIGRENLVHLTVKTGRQPAILQIRDYFPQSMTVTPETLQVRLSAKAEEELTYTVLPAQRGEFNWGSIQVRQLGTWGLAWNDWTIPQAQTVEVYPDLMGLRSLSLRLTLQTTGNLRKANRLGVGTEFAELREYSIGDDPRLIDWKASARRVSEAFPRNRPLLRVLEPEQEQTLIILLDSGRLMTAQINGLARFDWGLNAALSLALAGLNRGDRVGIGVFDRALHTWMPPERGQAQLAKLIDRLTPLQPTLQEPDYFSAVTTIAHQQTRRALVVLITDLIDTTASAELLAAMARLTPRYLPFCVALRDPQIDARANQRTQDIASSYERAVAIDLLNQRQLALATLKQKGVLILDAPANQITEELVDRYLKLKVRGQL
ncbi:MAG: DUF58 domain-containing protein [Drouetiella hepatica Uher 2000/2452]|jgi:uncharacterized protein (DUF58 family)|uniref:DUF58 domain-containing protein n=1 Tax=Drouetiella hepatica Uher 2000/2452 TaxID=904376 RepID=A0A951UPW6_9CYAN|nr:DUF58 domain-containing protein [Drouetiella hepatica Uher 2000/2452]